MIVLSCLVVIASFITLTSQNVTFFDAQFRVAMLGSTSMAMSIMILILICFPDKCKKCEEVDENQTDSSV